MQPPSNQVGVWAPSPDDESTGEQISRRDARRVDKFFADLNDDDRLQLYKSIMNGLNLNDLRCWNVTRCEEVFHPLRNWTPAEWAVAMAGESGEVCNAVKKLRRLEDGTNTAKDPQTEAEAVQAIADEIADTI